MVSILKKAAIGAFAFSVFAFFIAAAHVAGGIIVSADDVQNALVNSAVGTLGVIQDAPSAFLSALEDIRAAKEGRVPTVSYTDAASTRDVVDVAKRLTISSPAQIASGEDVFELRKNSLAFIGSAGSGVAVVTTRKDTLTRLVQKFVSPRGGELFLAGGIDAQAMDSVVAAATAFDEGSTIVVSGSGMVMAVDEVEGLTPAEIAAAAAEVFSSVEKARFKTVVRRLDKIVDGLEPPDPRASTEERRAYDERARGVLVTEKVLLAIQRDAASLFRYIPFVARVFDVANWLTMAGGTFDAVRFERMTAEQGDKAEQVRKFLNEVVAAAERGDYRGPVQLLEIAKAVSNANRLRDYGIERLNAISSVIGVLVFVGVLLAIVCAGDIASGSILWLAMAVAFAILVYQSAAVISLAISPAIAFAAALHSFIGRGVAIVGPNSISLDSSLLDSLLYAAREFYTTTGYIFSPEIVIRWKVPVVIILVSCIGFVSIVRAFTSKR